jgi:hypothetical protein
MSHQGKFNRRLDRLYRKRTGWLRTVLTKANPGPVPRLTKRQRERGIKRLQGIRKWPESVSTFSEKQELLEDERLGH